MSTSVKRAVRYALAAAVCAVFGLIYEHFSFGVWSDFMGFAFLIPLLLGALPALFVRRELSPVTAQLYGGFVLTLTLGSLVKGALDIYGTTNGKLIAYPILAGLMLLAATIYEIQSRSTAE